MTKQSEQPNNQTQQLSKSNGIEEEEFEGQWKQMYLLPPSKNEQ